MQKLILGMLFLCYACIASSQAFKQAFVTTDIDHFWKAYDKIIATKDSATRYDLLRTMYLNKGSAGLKAIIDVRNYTEKQFIDAILHYPKFWNSIRSNMVNAKSIFPAIEADILLLKKLYPSLKPATIYFTVGAFRTNGTIQGNKILLGSEMSLADKKTVVDELPERQQPYFKAQHPRNELPLLCTHEYVHTQQKQPVENLLSMCLYEGIAEFVSCKATGKKSAAPAIEFGKANEKLVVDKFVHDVFTMSHDDNWLWGENRNELNVRDLGYYIGYEMSERYFNQATNKQQAIKDLVELDYRNENEVERIVNSTNLLPKTLEELYQDYEKKRPTVTHIAPFENHAKNVKPGVTRFTILFSEPLLKYNTGVDFGPLGKDHFPPFKGERVFSEDGKSWSFEAELQPNKHYQILISNNFRKEDGVRLKPYLVDFYTGEE